MDLVTLLAVCAAGMSAPALDQCPGKSGGAQIDTAVRADDAIDALDSESSALSDIGRWQLSIDEASHRFGVPAAWIRAVMRAESGGRTMLESRPITSHAGAMGLMQVMPETYEEMRQRYGLGADPYGARDNILAGTAYLREMYDRYGYPGFLAAYNAGPARFDAYLLKGQPLPGETRRYLAVLNMSLLDARTRHDLPSESGLFFKLGISIMGTSSRHRDLSSDGLFVPLRKNLPQKLGVAAPRADPDLSFE